MAHKICKTLPKQNFDHHSRKCVICRHPDRAAIEEEFVHWGSAWDISRNYELGEYRTVYRHAHATGLTLRRRENLHSVLDIFLEKARGATMSGDSILRAIRAYSCVDSLGRWVDPPTQINHSTAHSVIPVAPAHRVLNSQHVINATPEQPASSSPRPSSVIDVEGNENVEVDESVVADENDEPDDNEGVHENVQQEDASEALREEVPENVSEEAVQAAENDSPSGSGPQTISDHESPPDTNLRSENNDQPAAESQPETLPEDEYEPRFQFVPFKARNRNGRTVNQIYRDAIRMGVNSLKTKGRDPV